MRSSLSWFGRRKLLHGLPRELPASIIARVHLVGGAARVGKYRAFPQVAARAREHHRDLIAARFEERAREAESNAQSLQNVLVKDKIPTG